MVTMSQIAEHLGLTRQTVSAVMNNRYKPLRISEETATRVREAADHFGYLRNHLALAVRTGQNNVIGCLLSGLASEWVSLTLSGLLAEASPAGYLVKIEEVEGDASGTAGLNRLIEQRVAALFCCNFTPSKTVEDLFARTVRQYKVATVACISKHSLFAHHISSDDFAGCELAVDHLWKLGHRRIAHLGASIDKIRMDGYLAAMNRRHAKILPSFVVDTDWNPGKAVSAIAHLLSLEKLRPTAIFCANDTLAALVIREARHRGLRVPEDLSVIGFSGSSLCASIDPPLTSISQPFREMGQLCGRYLTQTLGRAKPLPRKLSTEEVPVSLLLGQSTTVAPKI